MIQVNKALTPEEQAIVGNIKSLLTQLEGAVGEELPVQMSEGAEGIVGIDKCDDPNAFKGQPNSIEKDETANSTAESKLDELPVDDEEALSVLKSLLGQRQPVRKAARPAGSSANAEILKVLKSLTAKVTAQEAVLHEVLGGNELADRALGLRRVAKAAPRVPVQPSSQAILDALSSLVVQKSAESKPESAGNMADVLRGVWGV